MLNYQRVILGYHVFFALIPRGAWRHPQMLPGAHSEHVGHFMDKNNGGKPPRLFAKIPCRMTDWSVRKWHDFDDFAQISLAMLKAKMMRHISTIGFGYEHIYGKVPQMVSQKVP